MRILWLSGNPSMYDSQRNINNGGGWIGSLEFLLCKQDGIQLAVAFFYKNSHSKMHNGPAVYYPINIYESRISRIKHNIFYEYYDKNEINEVKKIINDFKPDLIHVWGTEISFGLISKYTTIPVVIHIQGLLNPCSNTFLIPGVSRKVFINKFYKGLVQRQKNIFTLRFWKHNVKREIDIIQNCKYFLGRTQWDKNITQLLSPSSVYFYASELLRYPFYGANPWEPHNSRKLRLISVLSDVPYKGVDLILRCANILKTYSDIEFEWNVVGITDCYFAEKITNINAINVGVHPIGIVDVMLLIQILHKSDIFIHPSYIDNSPNSVCEAQYIGIPVISTHVGGVESLIINGYSGILIPANDPFYLASQIILLYKDKDRSNIIGKNGREIAIKRHDPTTIISQIVSIYTKVIKNLMD